MLLSPLVFRKGVLDMTGMTNKYTDGTAIDINDVTWFLSCINRWFVDKSLVYYFLDPNSTEMGYEGNLYFYSIGLLSIQQT